MAESEACCPSRDNNSHNDLTESDMAAAYQLMLLSDEDNNHSIMGKRNRSFVDEEEEEVDQRNRSFVDNEEEEVDQVLRHLIPTKINKIFWKDEVLVTKKQRRYRSLQHIYMVTTPIHA